MGTPRSEFQLQIGRVVGQHKTALKDTSYGPEPGSSQPPPASQVACSHLGRLAGAVRDESSPKYLHNFEPSAWLGRPSACIHHRLRAGCFCLLGCLSLPSLPISFSAREDSTSWESSEHFWSAGQGLGFSSEHQHSSVPASNDTASPISGLDFGTDTGSGLVGCHRPLWPAGQAHPTQAVRVASFQDSQKAGT